MEQDTTDFGYRQVTRDEKTKLVEQVFSSVATKYDVMNDLMSCGIHHIWKKIAIEHCNLRSGQKVLDLAGGTGDLAYAAKAQVDSEGEVILADINHNMLTSGRDKLINKGVVAIQYLQLNAEELPFADNYFDCITIGFGLRNVTDKEKALTQMLRVLKPGGRLVILEFSKPTSKPLQKIYDLYSFGVLPTLGKLVANDASSYRYLAESIRMHPAQESLLQILEQIGFDNCSYLNLMGGICAIHKGFKF